VELPDGITTSNGNWYHITSERIEKYIPGLLKKYDVEYIVKNADYWVSSSNGLSLILFLGLSFSALNEWLSSAIAILFFFFWHFNTPAFAYPWLNPMVKLFDSDGFLYLSAASVLIYQSFQGNYLTMWLGLVLFFLFKVGLLKILLKWVTSKRSSNKPELQDRILNMLLIRYGMKEGLYSGNIQDMQDSLLKTVNYHKTRKNK